MEIKKKIKKRNPFAQELKIPKYKQTIVRNKKAYSRKGKKKGYLEFFIKGIHFKPFFKFMIPSNFFTI